MRLSSLSGLIIGPLLFLPSSLTRCGDVIRGIHILEVVAFVGICVCLLLASSHLIARRKSFEHLLAALGLGAVGLGIATIIYRE